MGKNILIYYQNPYRSIFFESIGQTFRQRGYTVYFLTKCDRGILHEKMEEFGVITAAYNPRAPRLLRFFYHWVYLIRYCRRNKISVVYSHLQLANLIALLAQYFIRPKVLPCRHHVDEIIQVNNRTALLIDKWVNRLSKKIIVVSAAVKQHMIEREKVNPGKIVVIPLGYNFDLYNKPDPGKACAIKKEMNCHLLLIIVARMTGGKRHIVALQVLNKLVKEGLDVKLIIMDGGPEQENLRSYIRENVLGDKVLFTGFLNNTMDYVAAAELLLHPSVIEASNQVVREAGILEKPCIVCKGVGNFDEYFVHRENGFLVSKENTMSEMSDIVKEYYNKKDQLKQIGTRFRKQVLDKFSIDKIVDEYLRVTGWPESAT